MIRDLTDTTTTEVSKTLVRLRNDVGAMALGRVLTLIVVVDDTHAAESIDIANHASRQHPCRIIAGYAARMPWATPRRFTSIITCCIPVAAIAAASCTVAFRSG